MKSIEWINLPFLKKSVIAGELFGEVNPTNTAYLHNKLKGTQGKQFSEEEIERLERIRKKLISMLV